MTTQQLQSMTLDDFHKHIGKVYWNVSLYKSWSDRAKRDAKRYGSMGMLNMYKHYTKAAEINEKVSTRFDAWAKSQIKIKHGL